MKMCQVFARGLQTARVNPEKRGRFLNYRCAKTKFSFFFFHFLFWRNLKLRIKMSTAKDLMIQENYFKKACHLFRFICVKKKKKRKAKHEINSIELSEN